MNKKEVLEWLRSRKYEFTSNVIMYVQPFGDDEEVMFEALPHGGIELGNILSDRLKRDENFALEVLSKREYMWDIFHEDLKENEYFIFRALKNNEEVWPYLSEEKKENLYFINKVLNADIPIWRYLLGNQKTFLKLDNTKFWKYCQQAICGIRQEFRMFWRNAFKYLTDEQIIEIIKVKPSEVVCCPLARGCGILFELAANVPKCVQYFTDEQKQLYQKYLKNIKADDIDKIVEETIMNLKLALLNQKDEDKQKDEDHKDDGQSL